MGDVIRLVPRLAEAEAQSGESLIILPVLDPELSGVSLVALVAEMVPVEELPDGVICLKDYRRNQLKQAWRKNFFSYYGVYPIDTDDLR